jgi:hypothetical protein
MLFFRVSFFFTGTAFTAAGRFLLDFHAKTS